MLKLGSIPLKIKLPAIIVAICLCVATAVSMMGYGEISSLASNNLQAKIISLGKQSQESVESFYEEVSRDILDMSSTPTVTAGYRRILMGWKSFAADPAATLVADYITNNPKKANHRKDFNRPETANTYNQQHGDFHPAFRRWTDLHGYYDLFLIDLDGNIIYTVMKETDFASNLVSGPEKKGPLAQVFDRSKGDISGSVHFSDFAPYGPSAGAPAAFAGRAILDEKGRPIGVMAVQMSEELLNATINRNSNLGETGNALIIGADGRARTASRFPGQFNVLDQVPNIAERVKETGDDVTVHEHVLLSDGETGSLLLSKLNISGLNWYSAVQIDDKEIYAPVRDAITHLTIGTIIGAAIATLVGIWIAKVIVKPITRVTQAIRVIAGGDLNAAIQDADRNDEVGDIAKSLDALREKLNLSAGLEEERKNVAANQLKIVEALSVGLRELSNGNLSLTIDTAFGDHEALRHDFNQAVQRLSETVSMVVDTAESIRSRAQEISQSSEDLSGRTETQAATLEETAAALDELTASIRSAADGAKEVETIVRSARNEAEESGKVVQGAVSAMTEIERSSDQISQIIGVIDDIAFQTNLLALNAGVEAARAGDAGKGFAVVASEVRALAQRSSAAAKEIKSLISASTQHVDRGVEQVGRAGDALENIVKRVSHISTLVSNIAKAAAEQSTGLAEINLGVSQLDQVTQQNAAMVEESTAASQSMSLEASGLSELVAQFQVRANKPAAISKPRAPVKLASVRSHEAPLMEVTPEVKPAPRRDPPPSEASNRSMTVSAKGKWQDF